MNEVNEKCQFRKHLTDFPKKICTVDYVGDPTLHANVGTNGFKGSVSAHAWNCRRYGRLFYLLLGPMLIAIGRPVGPINAVNGSNDATCCQAVGIHILYVVWIIKKIIFSLFSPRKSGKLHYAYCCNVGFLNSGLWRTGVHLGCSFVGRQYKVLRRMLWFCRRA